MKTFIIIKKSDLSFQGSYQAEEADMNSSASRSWLLVEPFCTHLELPEHLKADEVKGVLVDNQIQLAHDSAKEMAKLGMAWSVLRSKRDNLLWESDKYMMPDYPITSEKKAELVSYRNALRDLPTQVTDPREEIEWPILPEI